MSNIFKYKGTLLSEMFTTPDAGTATATYDIKDYYKDTSISTGLSTSVVEKYNTVLQTGYTINNNDICKYVCPTYSYWTQPANTSGGLAITIPSWARYMTIICIGGGGGGGAGSNGFKRNDPINQGKDSQNGGGGGGGSGAEYKIYRGLSIPTTVGAGGATASLTVEIGAGGQGGQGVGVAGNDGGTTNIQYSRYMSTGGTAVNMKIEARGGTGGQGGAEGQYTASADGNTYSPWEGGQWRGTDFTIASADPITANSGGVGSGNDRTNANGGNVNIYTDYLTSFAAERGGGGTGGTGSNYEDQGRADGDDAQGGYVRIYWMADM